jgi:uncharacterized protein YneR
MVMNDFEGNNLKVGDKVTFVTRITGQSELENGVVIGFSAKMVRVKFHYGQTTKISKKVIKR